MKNLYKLYYKDYFKNVDWSVLWAETKDKKNSNRNKLNQVNAEILNLQLIAPPPNLKNRANCAIPVKIEYPGLITGIGINHEANIEGEYKLGIHLDYLTGMPVVYGSTIKGVLRSTFNDTDYILSIFKRMNLKDWTPIDVEVLRHAIFEGEALKPGADPGKDESYEPLSIYKRDIFFDAVLIQADKKGRVICQDFITPHYKNVLRDPIPIPFIKIAPGCILELRFCVKDTELHNGLKFLKNEKITLFTHILEDAGIGAKTHVGYGTLNEPE